MGKTILRAIATAGTVIGLAACGVSSAAVGQPRSGQTPTAQASAPSSRALVDDAVTALKSASSVRISGAVVRDGKRLHLDVDFIQPETLSGTLSGSFAGTQARFKVIVAGGMAYILLDKAFFNALAKAHGLPASGCSRLCGRYISAPASEFGNFSLNNLTNSEIEHKFKVKPGVTVASVNGQPAYRVSYGHGTYLYIAQNSTHYPLEITKSGGGKLTFSHWNSVPPITAPSASKVISLPGEIG